jgi:hypothetical protein
MIVALTHYETLRRRRIEQDNCEAAWDFGPYRQIHVSSLLDKLDATGRTDAVAHAARRGVINL